jgi:hypothetical protein
VSILPDELFGCFTPCVDIPPIGRSSATFQLPAKCPKPMVRWNLSDLTSAVTRQRSNQLNYVPNRGINNLA